MPHVEQLREMKPGAEIVIATPGRLLDYVKKGTIVLNYIQFLILDEADRMLDMGFEKQLNEIVFSCNMPDKTKRQSLLFSATFSPEISNSANAYIENYIIASTNLNFNDNSGNKNIDQKFIFCEEQNKLLKIHEILQSVRGKVISKFTIRYNIYYYYYYTKCIITTSYNNFTNNLF